MAVIEWVGYAETVEDVRADHDLPAEAWLEKHGVRIPLALDSYQRPSERGPICWISPEVIEHSPEAPSEDWLSASNVPNFTAQPLELLYEWHGRKHMADNLSELLLCVELRWHYVPPIVESEPETWLYTGHGPWNTNRVSLTVRNIPARSSGSGVRSLRVRQSGPGQKRRHAVAGFQVMYIGAHECTPRCQCHQDWQKWQHWRPWEHPPTSELERWEPLRQHGLLTLYLKTLLWVHRSTEPWDKPCPYKDWRSVQYFLLPHLGRTVDRVYMWPEGVLNVPKIGPRVQQDRRYIKVWWQFFRKGAETKKPQSGGFSDVICSPSGKVPTRIGLDVTYTIVKNDPEEEVPYYKTHDSAAAIMAYLGCSKATAHREINKGFRIPEEFRTVTTAPLATTEHRLTLRILSGGGYMKLTPGPVYTSSGFYSEGVRRDRSVSGRGVLYSS